MANSKVRGRRRTVKRKEMKDWWHIVRTFFFFHLLAVVIC